MGRFTQIPESTFNELQMDAGVLLKNFDPADPNIQNSDIITATTGGVSTSCVPTYSDFFEDVDNAPNDTKEGKHLDGWECLLSTTALGTSPEMIRLSLGAADIDATTSAIVPRRHLEQTDFEDDIWWVGDRADGGFVAVRLLNALSDGGYSLTTTKNNKGQSALSIRGHVSINNQDVVPMEFYSMDPEETETTGVTGETGE